MDIHSHLREILRQIEAIEANMHDHLQGIKDSLHDPVDSYHNIQMSLAHLQEGYIMADIMDEYHQEVYVWYALGDDCDD
jgi:hypothetical protein